MKPFILALILAGCQPVAATTPSAWSPLAGSGFTSAPGSAGGAGLAQQAEHRIHPDVTGAEPVPGAAEPPSSTPRSARPTGLVPPYVAIRGVATFYAYVPGGAAAARALRDAIGIHWRGTRVLVCYAARCVHVVLSDYESSAIPGRLIDLDTRSFAALAGPGWYQRGVIPVVVVSW